MSKLLIRVLIPHLILFLLLLIPTRPRVRAEDKNDAALSSGALRESGFADGRDSVMVSLEFEFIGLTAAVEIDGKPVRLVVDTGAAGTILSPTTANKLGLSTTQEDSFVVRSLSGRMVTSRSALTRRITVGEAWTVNEPVAIARMPEAFAVVDGLLGISTLVDWDVRIDPSERTLTLFPAGKAPVLDGEFVLPLSCELANPEAGLLNGQRHRLINLGVPVRIAGYDLMVIPDTGYGGLLTVPADLLEQVAPRALKEALPALHTGEDLSGAVFSRTVELPELVVGSDTIDGIITDVTDAASGQSSCILGLDLLRHYVMTFRFSEHELRLKPLGTVQEVTGYSSAGLHIVPDASGRMVISSVVPDGPAAKASLRAGDEILEIEGRPLKTMKPEEFAAIRRLRPGTAVKVRYSRGKLEPAEVTLVVESERPSQRSPSPADLDVGKSAFDRGDYATALRNLKPLADHGDAEAQLHLGYLHENGLGVLQDFEEAFKWY